MIRLYLIQGGIETDVTARSEIVCGADATLRLCCEPGDGVIRATVRTADFRVNRNFGGGEVQAGADLGPALDYAAGLRLAIMLNGKPNVNLRFAVCEGEASTTPLPVDPFLREPVPHPVTPLVPTPVVPVVPAVDAEELALLKAQNADLQAQLSTLAAESSALRARNAELQAEADALRAASGAAGDAQRRIAELEQQLSDAIAASGLKADADTLTFEVDRLRRDLEQKKNERFELEMDLLPAATDALEQARSQLSQTQEQLMEANAALSEAQAAAIAAETALLELQARHTDAQRALTELQELRNQLGMQDEERALAEQQLAEAQSTLDRLTADLTAAQAAQAERQARLDELIAAEQADAQHLTEISAKREAYLAELSQLEKEIANLDHLKTHKAREWEDKVRGLSAILADVLQTQLDLRATYELLTIAVSDEMFQRRGEEARQKMAELEDCSSRLLSINEWVRTIRALQVQSDDAADAT